MQYWSNEANFIDNFEIATLNASDGQYQSEVYKKAYCGSLSFVKFMEKESNLSDNLQSRLFALGPAPPGFRPPDATAFATAESNLRNAIRYLNDTYGELDQLRTVIQKEKNNSKRTSYKAHSMMLAMQVIRFKGLIGKYRDILIGLQDAEIIKVKQYIEQMVEMRNKIQAKTDPTQREFQVGSSISLVQEQRKTKRICRRWRDRLVQLTEAKMDKTEQLTEKPKLINVRTVTKELIHIFIALPLSIHVFIKTLIEFWSNFDWTRYAFLET